MIDNSTAQDAIYLISCALNNKHPEINKIKKINKENLFEFAQYHMVSSTIAMALESAGVKDKLTSKYIASAQKKSIIFQCLFLIR